MPRAPVRMKTALLAEAKASERGEAQRPLLESGRWGRAGAVALRFRSLMSLTELEACGCAVRGTPGSLVAFETGAGRALRCISGNSCVRAQGTRPW